MSASSLAGIATVDWILFAVLLISVLVGIWRGLVFEVMSLAGWVLAWLVALNAGSMVGDWIGVGTPGSLMREAVGFGAAFLVTLLLCSLAARLVRALIAATPLSVIDRILGAGFGLLRGLLLLLVVAAVISWTPMASSRWWQSSTGAIWLGVLHRSLRPWLPVQLQHHVDQHAETARGA